jgi:D-galactarolactone cycloisomerase
MKITEVRFHQLKYPVKEKYGNSFTWNTARSSTVVEILTDAGITGWGQGTGPLKESLVQSEVVGRDPFEVEVIWDGLNGGRKQGNAGPTSGVDIALWDIMGKALDVPVYRLLGGAFRDRIPCYASGLFRKDRPDNTQALADEAKGYVDQGFPAMKMKVGLGRDYDVNNVAAVRDAIGDDILLAVDANMAYDVGTAIEVGRKMDAYDLFWYEEPITRDDVAGYLEIKQSLGMRISGCEGLQGRWAFREFIQQRAVDIVQPDIAIVGGFTEARKVVAMASANHIRVLPHMWGSVVCLAATLHWQAALPDELDSVNPVPAYFECDMTENGLRTELSVEPILPSDGYLDVPQGPGLGIEIDREVLEKYSV